MLIMAKQGSLSINSENIFPIIKKWLYSDHDIFIRELVSNAVSYTHLFNNPVTTCFVPVQAFAFQVFVCPFSLILLTLHV